MRTAQSPGSRTAADRRVRRLPAGRSNVRSPGFSDDSDCATNRSAKARRSDVSGQSGSPKAATPAATFPPGIAAAIQLLAQIEIRLLEEGAKRAVGRLGDVADPQ